MMDIPYCHSQCIVIYSTDAMSSDSECLIHKYSKAHWNIVWAYIYFLWYVFEIFHWKSDDKSPIHNTNILWTKYYHTTFMKTSNSSIYKLDTKNWRTKLLGIWYLRFYIIREMMQYHTNGEVKPTGPIH